MISIDELYEKAIKSCLTSNQFLDDTCKNRVKTATLCYSLRILLGDFTSYMKNIKYKAAFEKLTFIENIIDENINEEYGLVPYNIYDLEFAGINQSDVLGVSHFDLLNTFLIQLDNVTSVQEKQSIDILFNEIKDYAIQWKQEYINSSMFSLSKGIGSIGLGCEVILPILVEKILNKVRNEFPEIEENYLNYFKLHIFVDKEHGKVLVDIAKYLNEIPENRNDIENSLNDVLKISKAYWDKFIKY